MVVTASSKVLNHGTKPIALPCTTPFSRVRPSATLMRRDSDAGPGRVSRVSITVRSTSTAVTTAIQVMAQPGGTSRQIIAAMVSVLRKMGAATYGL